SESPHLTVSEIVQPPVPENLGFSACLSVCWHICGRVPGLAGAERTMAKNLYVGNLAFGTTTEDLREAFAQFGNVARAQVVTDRETGRSRGFGFVEMEDGADEAVAKMNGAN